MYDLRGWLPQKVPGMDKRTMLELFTALLTIFFAPLYNYPVSMKKFLQRRSFMALVVFGTIYVSFQSVAKAAVWCLVFIGSDLYFRMVDEAEREKLAEE